MYVHRKACNFIMGSNGVKYNCNENLVNLY